MIKLINYISLKACRYYGILDCVKWYKHHPEPQTQAKGTNIIWDIAIQTDGKIKSRRPDIEIKDYKRKKCLLIDVTISTDYNILVKNIVPYP